MPTHRRTLPLVAAALLLGGCAASGPGAGAPDVAEPTAAGVDAGAPVPAAGDIDPARLEPLDGLPACPDPPPAAPGADVADLPLPPEAVVTAASADGALRNVQGYTPRTPVEVMVAFLALDDWAVVVVEDEVFESEVLLERGELRVFVKSQATCRRGAAFVLFASDDPALVPAPAGLP